MHLELPKVRLASFKDFLKHYLMIVVSILTALGLEAWIEHVHHEHAAEIAVTRMEHELHDDLDAIDASIAKNGSALKSLQKLESLLQSDLKAGKSSAAINADIRANRTLFILDLNFPSLSTDAWDVAVANQSVGWIDASALQRYSSAYSAAREVTSWTQHDGTILFNGPRMVDYFTDLKLQNPVEPRAFLYVVHQLTTTIQSTEGELRSARDELRKDLQLPAPTHAS